MNWRRDTLESLVDGRICSR